MLLSGDIIDDTTNGDKGYGPTRLSAKLGITKKPKLDNDVYQMFQIVKLDDFVSIISLGSKANKGVIVGRRISPILRG